MKDPWYKSNRTWVGIGLSIFGLVGLMAENGILPPKWTALIMALAGAAVVSLRSLSK